MSYDISMKLHARTALADQRGQAQLEDRERESFLRRLDDAADTVNVTEFEAGILKTFLDGRWFWTGPRRHVVDEMMNRYRGRLGADRPKPEKLKSFPPTERGQCAYLVRGEQGQERCGEAIQAGTIYCETHNRVRAEWQERRRQMKERRF